MPFHVDERQKRASLSVLFKNLIDPVSHLTVCVLEEGHQMMWIAPSSAHSLRVLSQTGTSLNWVPNIKQKLFNPLMCIRFLQKCLKSLTVMSQRDSTSITNKWERETMTKEEERQRAVSTCRNKEMNMIHWTLLMAQSMKGEGITHKDTKLVSRPHWL